MFCPGALIFMEAVRPRDLHDASLPDDPLSLRTGGWLCRSDRQAEGTCILMISPRESSPSFYLCARHSAEHTSQLLCCFLHSYYWTEASAATCSSTSLSHTVQSVLCCSPESSAGGQLGISWLGGFCLGLCHCGRMFCIL